ncbi:MULTISPECIES: DUF6049 family protein [unclassified Streptosporangium]|uniref:DUF6049 family protein n=1 Tax=unclassified Streptosporangium TaxID=2632669 RepID=UPI002E2C47E3|nr:MULTISPECIES: DUF6049 family protein [unclassified Streptosporangium]
MIHKAALLALLATTLLVPAAVVVPGTANARTASVSRAGLQVVLEAIGPDAPRDPTTEIKLSGSLVNSGTEPLNGLRIRMHFSPQPFARRTDLETYLAGQGPQLSWCCESFLQAPIAASGKLPWEFSFTPQERGFSRFGVYPVMVEVRDAYGEQVATMRTMVTYMPRETKVARTRLATVLPIVDQPRRSGDTTFADEGLPAAMAPGKRLGDLLKIAQDTSSAKGLTWVVDPALLDDARAMGRPHTVRVKDRAQERPATPETAQWLSDFREAVADHPVVATPYGDPDVAALAHNGVDDATGTGIAAAAIVARETLGRDVITNVNWPVGGLIDYDGLDLLATGGVNTVLLNVLNLPPVTTPPVTTPDASATLESVNGPLTALVADAVLSETVGADTSAPGAALTNRQRFIAETAMISSEPVTTARTVIAVPHRRWDPDPEYVTDLVETAATLPWLAPVTLDAVKRGKGVPVPRAGLTYTDQDRKLELAKQYLTGVKRVGARADLTAAITTAQDLDVFDLALLRLTSSAWRGRTGGAAPYVQQVAEAIDGRIAKVNITGSEQSRLRTLAGSNGDVPISVRNELSGEASRIAVRLKVTSDQPDLLKIEPYEDKLEILGGQNQTIRIPMTSTASGQTTVTVQLTTDDERNYGKPVELTVRTTGYTGVALVIVGAALVVMLAAVVLRVLRRRGGRRPAAAPPPKREREPAGTES